MKRMYCKIEVVLEVYNYKLHIHYTFKEAPKPFTVLSPYSVGSSLSGKEQTLCWEGLVVYGSKLKITTIVPFCKNGRKK